MQIKEIMKNKKKIVILTLLILGLGCPLNIWGLGTRTIDMDKNMPAEFNAVIAKVMVSESWILVGEYKVHVGKFKVLNDRSFSTRLRDKEDKPLRLNAFKEGERVDVKGVMIDDENVIAFVVKKM